MFDLFISTLTFSNSIYFINRVSYRESFMSQLLAIIVMTIRRRRRKKENKNREEEEEEQRRRRRRIIYYVLVYIRYVVSCIPNKR